MSNLTNNKNIIISTNGTKTNSKSFSKSNSQTFNKFIPVAKQTSQRVSNSKIPLLNTSTFHKSGHNPQITRLLIEECPDQVDPEEGLGFKECEIEHKNALRRRRKSVEIKERIRRDRKDLLKNDMVDPRSLLCEQVLRRGSTGSDGHLISPKEVNPKRTRRKTVGCETLKKGNRLRRLSET